jgi:hypothetical protein
MSVHGQVFPHPFVGDDKLGGMGYQIELKPAEKHREASDKPKRAGDATALSSRSKRESRRICRGLQTFIIGL